MTSYKRIAALDEFTCEACRALHGRIVPGDGLTLLEPPRLCEHAADPGSPHECRCVMLVEQKGGWRLRDDG